MMRANAFNIYNWKVDIYNPYRMMKANAFFIEICEYNSAFKQTYSKTDI